MLLCHVLSCKWNTWNIFENARANLFLSNIKALDLLTLQHHTLLISQKVIDILKLTIFCCTCHRHSNKVGNHSDRCRKIYISQFLLQKSIHWFDGHDSLRFHIQLNWNRSTISTLWVFREMKPLLANFGLKHWEVCHILHRLGLKKVYEV